jgi:UPF0271 protein
MGHHLTMNLRMDLNCDMGESFGAWPLGQDDLLMEHITSANVACGFHAGDPGVMERTVRLAAARGVALGAHPGLPDLQGFGRRALDVTPSEAYALVLYQIGALAAFAQACGTRLVHVKPHGALYNMAAQDPALAVAIAKAARDFDPRLRLVGLSGSELLRAGENLGLPVASEVFADRSYEADGSLTPRSLPGALVTDADEAVARVLRMAREGVVRTRQGLDIPLKADTLCLHGDQPGAAAFARRIRLALEAAGVMVAPLEPGR